MTEVELPFIDEGIQDGDSSRRASRAHRRAVVKNHKLGFRKPKPICKVCHRRVCQCAYRAESFPGK